MNTGETLASILVQISTVVGVQVAIWWPRTLKPGTATARAFRALRYAAACLTAGFVLILATTGLPFEGTLLQRLLLAATLGTAQLTPLSSVALSLERGRRVRALYSTYGALLFAAATTWFCLLRGLFFLIFPIASRWQALCIAAALLCCAVAMVCIMEIYAAVRQAKALD